MKTTAPLLAGSTIPVTATYAVATSHGVILPDTYHGVAGNQFPEANATVDGQVRYVLIEGKPTTRS